MDITKVLEELRRELQYLDAAILHLERLQAKAPRRRGRPPKVLSQLHRAKGSTGDGNPRRGQREA